MFLGVCVMNELGSPRRLPPSFGIASVAAPVAGITLGWLLIQFGGEPGSWGLGPLFLGAAIFVLSTIFGGISALIAFGRKERFPGLSLFGLILNLAPYVLVLLFSFRR